MRVWSIVDDLILRSGSIARYADIEGALDSDDGAEIRADLPGIRFSDIELEPALVLSGSFPAGITAGLAVEKNGRLVPLRQVADGMLIDQTWHPIKKSMHEVALRSFAFGWKHQEKRIDAGAYIALIADNDPPVKVIDRVESDQSLRWATGLHELSAPEGLTAKLFPYQVVGSTVMRVLAGHGLGSLLADEMGLGKTVQVITLMLSRPCAEPSLVVAPAALLENWRRELAKFAPGLSVSIHAGGRRAGAPRALQGFDVVVTSYETLVLDRMLFESLDWGVVVADEAQMIRNPDTRRSATLKDIPRRVSIAVTGTPIENTVQDLWSVTEFVLPSLLGSRDAFNASFGNDREMHEYLGSVVAPLTIRRSVDEVAGDLPDRVDVYSPLSVEASTRSSLTEIESSNRGIGAFTAAQVVCAHAEDGAIADRSFGQQPKVEHVLSLLTEAFGRNEKVLIFGSYLNSIERLSAVISAEFPECYVGAITGEVAASARQGEIDAFSSSGTAGCLVLQIDAAGIGLNMTAANHVVFFNPDWNPAKTKQAAARAFRRGQNKPVVVHHLFYAYTVEEQQVTKAQEKQIIADSVKKGMSKGSRG